jgi:Fe-S cluster assembly protein SufD
MTSNAKIERGVNLTSTDGGVVLPAKSQVNFLKPETVLPYLALHDEFLSQKQDSDWVIAFQKNALEAAAFMGLPTPSLERYKFTNIQPALKQIPKVLGAPVLEIEDAEGVTSLMSDVFDDAPEWVCEHYAKSYVPPAQDKYGDMNLYYLNGAFLRYGVIIDVPAGQHVTEPVEITLHGPEGTFFSPRTLFRLGKGASLSVNEYHKGQGSFWNNRVTEIILEEGAVLHHNRLQDNPVGAVYTQHTHIQIAENARYEHFNLGKGCAVSRNQVHAELLGAGAHVGINGIHLLCGGQIGDATYLVEHKAPHCTSSQKIRNVLDDQAKGVFQGKVHVHQVAQKTDGYQLCNSMLLSEGAEMDTKPELEIYADDVKCSHGATTGQVDDESLFYLRSRGISLDEARSLLIDGFLGEIIDTIENEKMQLACRDKVSGWLKKA